MNFKNISLITAVIAFILGLGYFFFGEVVIYRWQMVPTETVLLFGRRMGALYLGFSIIFFHSRLLPISHARKILTLGAAITLSLLAILGIYEFALQRAGSGILISSAIEWLLAGGFIIVFIKDRKETE